MLTFLLLVLWILCIIECIFSKDKSSKVKAIIASILSTILFIFFLYLDHLNY